MHAHNPFPPSPLSVPSSSSPVPSKEFLTSLTSNACVHSCYHRISKGHNVLEGGRRERGRRGGREEERTDGSLIPLLRYCRTTSSSTGLGTRSVPTYLTSGLGTRSVPTYLTSDLGTRSVPTYLTSDFTNYSRKIKVFPLPVETGKSSGITCVAVTQTGI